jgi:hypothetical protein
MSKERITRGRRVAPKRRGTGVSNLHGRSERRGSVKTLADTRIYLPDIKPGRLAVRLVKALKTLDY